MDKLFDSNISIERFAAYLDGNLPVKDMQEVSALIDGDNMLKQIVEASDVVDDYRLSINTELPLELQSDNFDVPKIFSNNEENSAFSAIAALKEDNLCAIHCEAYALQNYGIDVTLKELVTTATEKGWLTPMGTSLRNIGKICEYYGLLVERRTNASIKDLSECLSKNNTVIVSVDEGELVGDIEYEQFEDANLGKKPDHVVIVTQIIDDKITIIDPYTPERCDMYSIQRFLDAWDDSNQFVTIIKAENI